MADPTQFEGWPEGASGGARDGSSKTDAYSNTTAWGGLGGNQRVNQKITRFPEHLAYSPASGAPLYDDEFYAGHKWTEAEGKVQEGSGPGDLSW